MKRKNTFTTKDVETFEKMAAEIEKMAKKMAEMKAKAYEMKEENRWMNYLGEEETSKLTLDEQIRLGKAWNTISYGEERLRRA